MPNAGMSRGSVVCLTKHERAVLQTLRWADEAAASHDYGGALEWLAAIEAIGEQLSDVHLGKRARWELAARGG